MSDMQVRSSQSELSRKQLQHSERLIKVLSILLKENCSGYEWFKQVHGFIRARDWPRLYYWSEVATTAVYSNAAEHFAANQIAALVLKAPFPHKTFGFTADSKTTAMNKFLASEERCRKSNRRFLKLREGYSRNYSEKLEWMRRWILGVLGESPVLEDINAQCGFSSGAALGVHGNATNLFRKFYSKDWTVTPCAVPYVYAAICSNEQFFTVLATDKGSYACYDKTQVKAKIDGKLHMVSFNKVEFVPKTAKTDRSIAVEPLLNSYLQKGVDGFMRQRLLSRGYDLGDQSRNAYLARVGSTDGSLATLDLSSASDSISIELVRYLLPPLWFEFLNRIRSPSYFHNGRETRYEKFVSMGNGFCFPLETLIFASAARACLRASERFTHAVYGDDIIVPTDVYVALVKLLAFMGFAVNPGKSFHSGPFRESCGADWYEGQDVRPVYLDYLLDNTSSLMIFHNATLRSARVSDFFSEVRPFLRSCVPAFERLCRPFRGYRSVPKGVERITLKNLNGAFDVEPDIFMSSRGAAWNRDEQRWSWREFHYSPASDHSDLSEFQHARYLAFLLGSPEGALYLRRKTTRRIIKR